MNYKHTNLQINLEELKTIDNVKNGNIEVPIILPDGYQICVSVATPQNLQSIMDANEVDFLAPECIFIIVNELTEKIIIKAINRETENLAFQESMIDKIMHQQHKNSVRAF